VKLFIGSWDIEGGSEGDLVFTVGAERKIRGNEIALRPSLYVPGTDE